jgi:hypothetical protein
MPSIHYIHGEQAREIPGRLDALPDTCPSCKRGVEPRVLYAYLATTAAAKTLLYVVVACPIASCQQLYFGTYLPVVTSSTNKIPDRFIQISTEFLSHISVPTFSDPISNLSPDFVDIYQQSSIAEANGLDAICGCGYRKSLEFIIKDYLSSLDHDRTDEIRNTFLGALIKQIPDTRIQGLAERATWLGNDETHYVRKWTDMDVRNLKALIQLTVYYIDAEEVTRQYNQDMPSGKK